MGASSSPRAAWPAGPGRALAAGLLGLLGLLGPACGSETGEEGPLQPPPNGVHVSEAAACETLRSALVKRREALGCSVTTTRVCPQFVRVAYEPDCVEFDEGSVQGCADHFAAQETCEDLEASVSACVAVIYPGTEPGGCP